MMQPTRSARGTKKTATETERRSNEVSEDRRKAARSEPNESVERAQGAERAGANKRRGRPSAFGETVLVGARLPVGLVAMMDAIIEANGFLYRDRSEFLRILVAEKVAAADRVRPEADLFSPVLNERQLVGQARHVFKRLKAAGDVDALKTLSMDAAGFALNGGALAKKGKPQPLQGVLSGLVDEDAMPKQKPPLGLIRTSKA
jgi:hypothetical protein